VSKTALGIRPFNSLRRKNSEYKILLVQSFGELKGDLTGSSNSKSFSVEKIHKARSLKCQYITRATSASSKLYNRELAQPSILSKIQKLSTYTQKNSPNRGVLGPPRRGVPSVKLGRKYFVRRHLNCAWLLQGGS
jgi:hypothetical protein